MKIKDIMTKDVITVNKNTSLSEAADLLFNNHLSGLPVVEKQRVAGIVTEGDLITNYDHLHIPSYIKFLECLSGGLQCPLKFQNDYKKMVELKVETVMTKQVLTVNQNAQISQAIEIFRQNRINPLPVVDQDNKLRGIVSRSDIVKLFTGTAFFKTPFGKRVKIKTLSNDICRTLAQITHCRQAALFLSYNRGYKIFGAYCLRKGVRRTRRLTFKSPFVLTIKKSSDWLICKEKIDSSLPEFAVLFSAGRIAHLSVDYVVPLRLKRKFIGFLVLGNPINAGGFDQVLAKHIIKQAGIYLEQALLKQHILQDHNELVQTKQICHYIFSYLTDGAILIDYRTERISYLNKAMREILSVKNYQYANRKINDLIKERPDDDLSVFLSFYKERKNQRRSFKKPLFTNQELAIGDKKFILNSRFIFGAKQKKTADLILIKALN